MIRLLRSVPELITVLKGMRAALRAVASTFGMVLVLIYVFAILFRLLFRDDPATEKYFGTLGISMGTLVVALPWGHES